VSEHIKTDQSKGVLTLILARPDKKNALTDDMYSALADALEASDHAPETRVVLIRLAMWVGSSKRSRAPSSLSSPPCRAGRSESERPCCCIAIRSF
jgi:hypothetical protein